VQDVQGLLPAAPKSSKFKGVSWHKHSQKWYAYIQHSGKMHGLGYFHDQLEAAAAYDAEAKKVDPSFSPFIHTIHDPPPLPSSPPSSSLHPPRIHPSCALGTVRTPT